MCVRDEGAWCASDRGCGNIKGISREIPRNSRPAAASAAVVHAGFTPTENGPKRGRGAWKTHRAETRHRARARKTPQAGAGEIPYQTEAGKPIERRPGIEHELGKPHGRSQKTHRARLGIEHELGRPHKRGGANNHSRQKTSSRGSASRQESSEIPSPMRRSAMIDGPMVRAHQNTRAQKAHQWKKIPRALNQSPQSEASAAQSPLSSLPLVNPPGDAPRISTPDGALGPRVQLTAALIIVYNGPVRKTRPTQLIGQAALPSTSDRQSNFFSKLESQRHSSVPAIDKLHGHPVSPSSPELDRDFETAAFVKCVKKPGPLADQSFETPFAQRSVPRHQRLPPPLVKRSECACIQTLITSPLCRRPFSAEFRGTGGVILGVADQPVRTKARYTLTLARWPFDPVA
ncbi:hypothetical protein DFH06DRAFT_1308303, partial [Mycena polygramma]